MSRGRTTWRTAREPAPRSASGVVPRGRRPLCRAARRGAHLPRLLGRLLLGLQLALPAAGCDRLVADGGSRARPAPLERGAVLHLTPEGMSRLVSQAVAGQDALSRLAVTVAEGFLPLADGGMLTYGPETWEVPLSLGSLAPAHQTVTLVVLADAPPAKLTVLYRPRFGALRRCPLRLTWPGARLELELAPENDAAGQPRLAIRSSTLTDIHPQPGTSPECEDVLDAEQQELLADAAMQALSAALEEHAATLAAGAGAALGLGLAVQGVVPVGAPAGGSLALELRAGDTRALEGVRGLVLGEDGMTLPLSVGLEARDGGRCGPAPTVEPGAPIAAPSFDRERSAPATLALSGQLLGRIVSTVLEAGFPCQPLRGDELPGLSVADLPELAGLAQVAPASAPLSVLLRPGEPATLELTTEPPHLRLELRRVALDLYVRLDGADLRALAATADVAMELALVEEEEGKPGLALRQHGLTVTPRWVSSELLPPSGDGLVGSLDSVYRRMLALALDHTLRLPGPQLGTIPLRLQHVGQAGGYLLLEMTP